MDWLIDTLTHNRPRIAQRAEDPIGIETPAP
jgi:hypothetical protein